jgi:hypothetical protein
MTIIQNIIWFLVGSFVIIEFVLIALVFFKNVEKRTFEYQLASVSGTFILLLNIMMVVIYWNYAGMPFKSDHHS